MAMNKTKGLAAIFDLDRTLIDINSGWLYARYERRHKRISLWQLGESLFWLGLYHLSLTDIEEAYRRAVRYYKGIPEKEMRERVEEFFTHEVAHRLIPDAMAKVNDHRRKGHRIVMATNASAMQASLAAETWGFDDWLANSFPTDKDGRLLGTLTSPLCYSHGKLARVKEWSQQHHISLSRSYFYSDSHSDLPLLLAVGHPRVVNPDPRLKRFCQKKGWKYLQWCR